MILPEDLDSLWLTLKLAATSLFFLFLLGLPLSWWLARGKKSYLKIFIEALVALPLVLPPTVIGFYLLLAFGSETLSGKWLNEIFGSSFAFSFKGLVLGSIIYSLPFVVQPLQAAFVSLGQRPLEIAASLGAKPLDQFFNVVLPLSRPGLLTAAVLGFAHTLGEFGVVLMIGGSIPKETKVVSISIYDHVEALDYGQASQLSLVMLVLSLFLLIGVFYVNRKVTGVGQ